MLYWFMLLFFSLLTPGAMVFFGWLWKKHPPRNINGAYGYRTERSMKSPEAWAFAHAYAGKIWRLWGGITLAATALAFPLGSLALCGWELAGLAAPEHVDAVSWYLVVLEAVQLVVLVFSIYPVERALKRNFG